MPSRKLLIPENKNMLILGNRMIKIVAFDRYIKEGGMSGSYLYKEQEEKYKYLADIFDTLILRDIRQKYKIRNIGLMGKIAEFMMDNISNLTSSRKIAVTLTKNADNINHKTVGAYLDYLCNAFAFYKVKRYDIRGKKYLSSSEKYYLSDHAFRYAKLGTMLPGDLHDIIFVYSRRMPSLKCRKNETMLNSKFERWIYFWSRSAENVVVF